MRVLVTGATGYTGSRLACAPCGSRPSGASDGPRSRPRDGDTRHAPESSSSSGICAIRESLRAAAEGDRRRLQHRGACTARPGFRRQEYRQVNAEAVEPWSSRRRRRRRASRRALQHGRRPRRRRASAGQRGRPAQARRQLPANEARRRSARPRRGGAPASSSSIARPTGIYGPGDRRLLKLFRGVARRRFVVLGDGPHLLPSDLYRRPAGRLPALR